MSKQYMVGGGTVTFVSSSPPLGMRFAKVGFLVSLRGYHFFVTFSEKYHQKLGVFGRLLIQYGTSFGKIVCLFLDLGV